MGRGRIRSVGQKKCFGDASVWPELLRLRDLNLGFTISDILLQRNVSVVGCEKAVILMQCCRFSPHTLYYVHMVPDFYERVGTVDRTAWEKLLPEVHDEG